MLNITAAKVLYMMINEQVCPAYVVYNSNTGVYC